MLAFLLEEPAIGFLSFTANRWSALNSILIRWVTVFLICADTSGLDLWKSQCKWDWEGWLSSPFSQEFLGNHMYHQRNGDTTDRIMVPQRSMSYFPEPTLCYITLQRRITVADRIKFPNQLTSRCEGCLGLSR